MLPVRSFRKLQFLIYKLGKIMKEKMQSLIPLGLIPHLICNCHNISQKK